MDFIGFDLGKVSSQVCIITEGGELVERRIRTDREQIGKLLGDRPGARILIEASTESEWVARFLEGLGHEVVVADTNFAPMYATRSRRVKTDKRDARSQRPAASAPTAPHTAPPTGSATSGLSSPCARRWCAPAPGTSRSSARSCGVTASVSRQVRLATSSLGLRHSTSPPACSKRWRRCWN